MKNNDQIKWYVASQEFPKTANAYKGQVYFIRLTPNEDTNYEYEAYLENATPMISQEEAEMYAFALNFNQHREWSNTYYFAIAASTTNLPKLPKNEESEEM